MSKDVKSIEELKRAQAGAYAQGGTVPNYNEWSNILKDFAEMGVKPTGSFDKDKLLHLKLQTEVQNIAEKDNVENAQKLKQAEISQPDKIAKSDNEQVIKATVANGTSSLILADYMKYYHLLA